VLNFPIGVIALNAKNLVKITRERERTRLIEFIFAIASASCTTRASWFRMMESTQNRRSRQVATSCKQASAWI